MIGTRYIKYRGYSTFLYMMGLSLCVYEREREKELQKKKGFKGTNSL
jgi:hypothetical protein